jgi:hypothetical protein
MDICSYLITYNQNHQKSDRDKFIGVKGSLFISKNINLQLYQDKIEELP